MRLKKPDSRYPLHQSPLYRLRGKDQFEKVLEVRWDAIERLLSPDNYRVWFNEKKREIQQPLGWLAHVHSRIGSLFSRIEQPDYLYSQKWRSYADNARQHVRATPLIKTDINKFYPSTTWQMVYRMFLKDFDCAKDIARNLANICCYRQEHLPTGSPLSGRIAFFAAKPMFDEIALLVANENCFLTVYVDDLTISGPNATKKLLGEVRKIIRIYGFKTNHKKSLTYAPYSAKAVTGTIIAGDELRLPNERHRKIWLARKDFEKASPKEKSHIGHILRGRLQEANQVLSPKVKANSN